EHILYTPVLATMYEPVRTPPFPYTTLFRSRALDALRLPLDGTALDDTGGTLCLSAGGVGHVAVCTGCARGHESEDQCGGAGNCCGGAEDAVLHEPFCPSFGSRPAGGNIPRAVAGGPGPFWPRRAGCVRVLQAPFTPTKGRCSKVLRVPTECFLPLGVDDRKQGFNDRQGHFRAAVLR